MVVIDGSANLMEDIGMVDDEVLADVERELLRVLQCLEGLEELRSLILDLQCFRKCEIQLISNERIHDSVKKPWPQEHVSRFISIFLMRRHLNTLNFELQSFEWIL